MTTRHDNTATTWRDVADQLTPEQVRQFERYETLALTARDKHPGEGYETVEDIARGFLSEARWEAQQNLNDTLFGVPVPAGAEEVEHWEDDGTGTWTRRIHGRERTIEGFDAAVYFEGIQHRDGTVTWSLHVHVEDGHAMTSAQVRQLAGYLLEAADELDGWTR